MNQSMKDYLTKDEPLVLEPETPLCSEAMKLFLLILWVVHISVYPF